MRACNTLEVSEDRDRPAFSFQARRESIPAVIERVIGGMAEALEQQRPRAVGELMNAARVALKLPLEEIEKRWVKGPVLGGPPGEGGVIEQLPEPPCEVE